jgi:hypothetical protein
MSEFKINNDSDTFEKDKQKDLSEKERNQFKDEFDEINDLINATLDSPDDINIPSSTAAKVDDPDLGIKNDPLAINDNAAKKADQLRQKLIELGIKKSDRTGKQLKASGDD